MEEAVTSEKVPLAEMIQGTPAFAGVTTTLTVIAGLVPAIHGSDYSACGVSVRWIAGMNPAMTNGERPSPPENVPLQND
jgi:hypothetical protein